MKMKQPIPYPKLNNHNIIHSIHKNYTNIRTSIISNTQFWITITAAATLCALLQRDQANIPTKIFMSSASIILTSIIGWYAHLISHSIDFANIYKHIIQNSPIIHSIITNIPPIDSILITIANTLDFHHKIHHDSSVNKKTENLIIEFIQNAITQGIGLAIIFNGISINTGRGTPNAYFNGAAMTMYGLLYASAHIINYNLFTSVCHEHHHKQGHECSNLGIDILDIAFDNKYDPTCIEDINHYSINISAICIGLYLIHKYTSTDSVISTFLFGTSHNT
jgi:hypothetical protein